MKITLLFLTLSITGTIFPMLETLLKKQKIEEKKDTSLLGKFPTDIKKIILYKMLEKTLAEQEEDERSIDSGNAEQSKRNLKAFKKSLQGIRRYMAHEEQFKNTFKNIDTSTFIFSLIKNLPAYHTVKYCCIETDIEVKRLLIAAALGTPRVATMLHHRVSLIKEEDEIIVTLYHAAEYNFIQPFTFLLKCFPYYIDDYLTYIDGDDNDDYDSLLTIATKKKNREIVRTALKYGANVNFRNSTNDTALAIAFGITKGKYKDESSNSSSLETNSLNNFSEDIAKDLLAAGAMPDPTINWESIPLGIKNKIVSLLLEYNALPLHIAYRIGDCDIIKKIIKENHYTPPTFHTYGQAPTQIEIKITSNH